MFKYYAVNSAKTIVGIKKIATFGMMQEFVQCHDWLKILTIYGYANG